MPREGTIPPLRLGTGTGRGIDAIPRQPADSGPADYPGGKSRTLVPSQSAVGNGHRCRRAVLVLGIPCFHVADGPDEERSQFVAPESVCGGYESRAPGASTKQL